MNTYGQHSNASLLHMYGFTEPGNPHDEVTILHVYVCTLSLFIRLS